LFVYLFEEGNTRLRKLLGGKGADLAEMTSLGLPVPPGLTITTEACNYYSSNNGKFPEGLEKEILTKIKVLEARTGRVFGDPTSPLLVSVRSGAPISMPGMMDTVLNLGLNDNTIKGLIYLTSNERLAYDAYRRFIQMFGKVVLNVKSEKFESIIAHHKERLNAKSDVELAAKTLACRTWSTFPFFSKPAFIARLMNHWAIDVGGVLVWRRSESRRCGLTTNRLELKG